MEIKALETFGFDLSEQEVVRAFAQGLPASQSQALVLDLSGCILDYPATSILVDRAIESLQSAEPPRQLTLIFNIAFPKRALEKWFFFGSELLPQDYHSLSEDTLRSALSSALEDKQTTLKVVAVNSVGAAPLEIAQYG